MVYLLNDRFPRNCDKVIIIIAMIKVVIVLVMILITNITITVITELLSS